MFGLKGDAKILVGSDNPFGNLNNLAERLFRATTLQPPLPRKMTQLVILCFCMLYHMAQFHVHSHSGCQIIYIALLMPDDYNLGKTIPTPFAVDNYQIRAYFRPLIRNILMVLTHMIL